MNAAYDLVIEGESYRPRLKPSSKTTPSQTPPSPRNPASLGALADRFHHDRVRGILPLGHALLLSHVVENRGGGGP